MLIRSSVSLVDGTLAFFLLFVSVLPFGSFSLFLFFFYGVLFYYVIDYVIDYVIK